MMEYSKENRGVLFKNDDKQSDNHPDYKGSINIDGIEYWLSSWIKTSKQGNKFMSLSVQPKQQQATKPVNKAKQAPQVVDTNDFDDMDGIPF